MRTIGSFPAPSWQYKKLASKPVKNPCCKFNYILISEVKLLNIGWNPKSQFRCSQWIQELKSWSCRFSPLVIPSGTWGPGQSSSPVYPSTPGYLTSNETDEVRGGRGGRRGSERLVCSPLSPHLSLISPFEMAQHRIKREEVMRSVNRGTGTQNEGHR